ncbi:MAG: zinc-binding alcohol dehydrogenase [Actinomycetota bacterium]|nr:zinc-binding alcohol dehydrogenase [Actinomycetota bacterium]
MRSLALEFYAPRSVRLKQVELPPLRRGDVLVRTLFSGISSGTEMLAYRGELDPQASLDESIGSLSGSFSYPFQYGYSCVGIVEESQSEIAPGTLVFCFHPHQQFVVCSRNNTVVVDGIDPRLATLFPLVETALQISLDAGPVAEQTVLVTGLGSVGILAAALLIRAGARPVGVDPKPWRRAVAESFGIEAIDAERLQQVMAARPTGGVPLLVEASGNPEALADGLALLEHEGTALVASWYGAKLVPLPLGGDFHRRRLTIRSSQVSSIPAHLSKTWTIESRRAATRVLLDELPLKYLATHEFDLYDAAQAYEAVSRLEPGLVHAAIRYEGAELV